MSEHTHRSVMLAGPVGKLEALLWEVSRGGDETPAARMRFAAVVCHPHPLYGGTMHNKVVYRTAKTLHRLGLPVLRFNFRGVGLSAGSYDGGKGEQEDLHAALDFLGDRYPDSAQIVAGFSFGAWVGLRVGCRDPRVSALVGLGLPVGDVDASYLAECTKPKLLLSGDRDQYGPKEKWNAIISVLPEKVREATQLIFVHAADHFLAGHIDVAESEVSAWVKKQMNILEPGSSKGVALE